MLNATLDISGAQAKVAAWKAAAESGLKTGAAAGAQLFESEAKTLVPVLSGNLRDHIHTEPVTDTPQLQVLAVTPTVEAANRYGFDPPYARRIEKGFVGTDSLGRHFHQAAEPYMAPTFENTSAAAAEAIGDGIRDALKGVA